MSEVILNPKYTVLTIRKQRKKPIHQNRNSTANVQPHHDGQRKKSKQITISKLPKWQKYSKMLTHGVCKNTKKKKKPFHEVLLT